MPRSVYVVPSLCFWLQFCTCQISPAWRWTDRLPREGWVDEKGACAVSSCSSYHQWIADNNNRLFLGFQCRKSGAFSWSWVWLNVPTASQSQGFSWLHLLLNSNAWEYSCQGYGGHVGMWQYPTYISQIKWLIHKENLSHPRNHAKAECWLDCKHPLNGWTHCNRGHFKQIFFGVWAQILRQDEKIHVLSGVWGLKAERGPLVHVPTSLETPAPPLLPTGLREGLWEGGLLRLDVTFLGS